MRWIVFILLVNLPVELLAQQVTVGGIVWGADEKLPGANILIVPDSTVTSSDIDGNFFFKCLPGQKHLTCSFTGFYSITLPIHITTDTTLRFDLKPFAQELEVITVESSRFSSEDQLNEIRTGGITMSDAQIKSIPVLLGEADPIKAVQLLPGSTRGMEGTSDVFVRGGAADQNLVLLDGAPIYNPSHLLGFISIFNPDAIDRVAITSGGFPAQYGGRLSSVLSVTTQDRIPEKTSVAGEVGLLATRLKVEQPILKQTVGLWLASRHSYIDKVMKSLDRSLPYFFSDLNGKINIRLSNRGTLHLSHYNGRDVLDFLRDKDGDGKGMTTTFRAKNTAQSLQYEQRAAKLESSFSMFRSQYRYVVTNVYKDYHVIANSNVLDYGARLFLRADSAFSNVALSGGVEYIKHSMDPNMINSVGSISNVIQSGTIPAQSVNEFAVHLEGDVALSRHIATSLGFRMSAALGNKANYTTPEPRIAFRFQSSAVSAAKISYSRMAQYLHRVTNSTVSTPIDIWTTVTDTIQPQRSHQFSMGWQRYINRRSLFFSIDAYYKPMSGLVMYEEGTNFLTRNNLASRLVRGKGKAQGTEILLRKENGKLTGWISYTLSWSWRQFNGINNNNWFPARYDRRNVGAIVAQYKLSTRLSSSFVWEYISGSRFTPIIGRYMNIAPNYSGVELVPVYSGVNAMKLSDSHRLDVGLKFLNKPAATFEWSWSVGIYNVYNRTTPIGVIMDFDEESKSLKYTQPGLFGFLPFVSYGCKI